MNPRCFSVTKPFSIIHINYLISLNIKSIYLLENYN